MIDAKAAGSNEILKHLRLQPGVPSPIILDDDCTDFYPGMIKAINMIYVTESVTESR